VGSRNVDYFSGKQRKEIREAGLWKDPLNSLRLHAETGGPRATSGPRPLASRLRKLFVNLLLITVSLFIFFAPKDIKIWRFLSGLLLYVQVPHVTEFEMVP
jgi:hypothetical protein